MAHVDPFGAVGYRLIDFDDVMPQLGKTAGDHSPNPSGRPGDDDPHSAVPHASDSMTPSGRAARRMSRAT